MSTVRHPMRGRVARMLRARRKPPVAGVGVAGSVVCVAMNFFSRGLRRRADGYLGEVTLGIHVVCRSGHLRTRLPTPVRTGSGVRVCGCPHSQRSVRSPVVDVVTLLLACGKVEREKARASRGRRDVKESPWAACVEDPRNRLGDPRRNRRDQGGRPDLAEGRPGHGARPQGPGLARSRRRWRMPPSPASRPVSPGRWRPARRRSSTRSRPATSRRRCARQPLSEPPADRRTAKYADPPLQRVQSAGVIAQVGEVRARAMGTPAR